MRLLLYRVYQYIQSAMAWNVALEMRTAQFYETLLKILWKKDA